MSIHKRLSQVMKDCRAVGKDSFNPQQKYSYRGIDAVYNALNPAMSKNGVFVVPEVLDISREERESRNGATLIYSTVTVKYTFYAEDGTSVACVVMGEGMDSGDKSINKAMSAAFKYACFQTFCIPTDEMIDSDTESPEPQKKAEKKTAEKKKADDAGKAKIGEVKARALLTLLGENKIDYRYILKGYDVQNLAELTESQHKGVKNNLEQIKRDYDEWKKKDAS